MAYMIAFWLLPSSTYMRNNMDISVEIQSDGTESDPYCWYGWGRFIRQRIEWDEVITACVIHQSGSLLLLWRKLRGTRTCACWLQFSYFFPNKICSRFMEVGCFWTALWAIMKWRTCLFWLQLKPFAGGVVTVNYKSVVQLCTLSWSYSQWVTMFP